MWHHLHFSHMEAVDGGFTGGLGEFVDEWLAGRIAFGTWLAHVSKWLAAAERDSRALVLRYEDLQSDLRGAVQRIAVHLGAL